MSERLQAPPIICTFAYLQRFHLIEQPFYKAFVAGLEKVRRGCSLQAQAACEVVVARNDRKFLQLILIKTPLIHSQND